MKTNLGTRIMRGITSPAKVYMPSTYVYPHHSVQDALRGDWIKVSNDVNTVIKRPNDRNAKSRR